jgi:hypothetical protein
MFAFEGMATLYFLNSTRSMPNNLTSYGVGVRVIILLLLNDTFAFSGTTAARHVKFLTGRATKNITGP